MDPFFYPYANMQDAVARIGHFVDHAFGPGYGIIWSDGRRAAMLRRAHVLGDHGTYVNVLRKHVSAPPPPSRPAANASFFERAKNLFWHLMEQQGELEIANSQAQMAASRAIIGAARDNVWEPAHRWLMGHKKTADGLGVALDAVGVAAAVVFAITFAPEIGAFAIATATVAGVSSLFLLAADGAVFSTEMLGYKETSEAIEGNHALQWARLIATGLTLLDVPVGGSRALVEIGKLSREAEEAATLARAGDEAAAAARARIGKIANPAKHPVPVARRTRQAGRLAQQADAQHRAALSLSGKVARTRYFDAPAALGATPAAAALLGAAPPDVALSERQRHRDEEYRKSLEPAGGMPRDVKLELRVSSIGKAAHAE